MQPLQCNVRCPAAEDNSITHAAAAPSNLAAAITMRYRDIELQNTIELQRREKLQLQSRILAPKQKKHDFDALFQGILKRKSSAPKLRKSADKSISQLWCSHSNTIYDVQLQKTRVLRTQPRRQTTKQPAPPHTGAALHRHLQPLQTEKHKVSCSGFLPNRSPMQHSCGHYNRFCSITWQTCMYLRTWQHQMTTIMQPFQCDLQPPIQETHRTTHTWSTTRCRTPRENRFDETIAAAAAAHTRYPSSPPAATLRRKTQGFVLRLPPQHKPHAIFMQPLQ